MKEETTLSISKRLSRIEGQVKGVAKMINDDRYCIDIVRQIQAIKRLSKLVLTLPKSANKNTR